MPRILAASIVCFLLLGAGYGLAQAARAIPWDCSDWQAFVHEDRTIAILESLAENRGKALYCGVDQSDTFSKAETWEAGKDRNERDDTIYSGERGIFRGFIAAQEGYLTDGESGVTGQSIDRIFEFPREKKKRRRYKKVTLRLVVNHGDGDPVRSPRATTDHAAAGSNSLAQQRARVIYNGNPPTGFSPALISATFQALAETAATTYCTNAGYERAVGVGTGLDMWDYGTDRNPDSGINFRALKYRTWRATCEKEVRRRR